MMSYGEPATVAVAAAPALVSVMLTTVSAVNQTNDREIGRRRGLIEDDRIAVSLGLVGGGDRQVFRLRRLVSR